MAKNPDVYYPNVAIPDCPNGFNYSKSHIVGNLYGIESKFGKDSFINNAQIDGEVHFERMFSNSNTLYMKKIKAKKKVFFNELKVWKVRLDDSVFYSDIEMSDAIFGLLHARRISAYKIVGNNFGVEYVDLKDAKVKEIIFRNATILHKLKLLNSNIENTIQLSNTRMHYLLMNDANIANINFNKTSIDTLWDLSDAKIKECSGISDLKVKKTKITHNTRIPSNLSNYLDKRSKIFVG